MNDNGYGLWFLVLFNSALFIVGGFWLIATAWRHLYAAQRAGKLATEGPYARVRHPQYVGLLLIMLGFLLQWPTLATLVMFPVLVYVYRRLAIREEGEVRSQFGAAYDRYAARVPRLIPHLHQAPAEIAAPLGGSR